jgi:hypothetical protein
MVKSIVIFRNKTNNRVETIYQPIVRRVVDILYGCDSDTSIEYLKSKINTYINKYYEICIDVEYSKIEPLYKFISDNKLNKYMTDCSEQWIANIVQFIHDEFDYETICEISTDTHEVGDLFSKEYVKDIVSDKKLYYGLSPDSANRIIDFISTIVAIYVN